MRREGDDGSHFEDVADASRVLDGSIGYLDAPPNATSGVTRAASDDAKRYVDGPLLGRGGMGIVRLVHDQRIGRDVALKRPISEDPQRGARFLREASIAATLEHPGIVPVHDVGTSVDGTPYYTMRVVRGETLAVAIKRAPNAAARRRLLRHVRDAAQAVAYAHHRGVLHRDLKPANVVVGEFGETQVVDWGLADFATSDERGGGTPRYMSPEQRDGAPIDPRTDVWGLGMILGEVLTGAAPDAHRFAAPSLAALPPELRAILARATASDPGDRYPSARDFVDDLGRFLDARPVAAHAYSLLGHLRRLWRGRRGALVVALISLVLVVVLTLISVIRIVSEREHAIAAEASAVAQTQLAERHLGAALTAQALLYAAADARPEAELAAARALASAPDPEALGVLAAYAAVDRPVPFAGVPTPPCARVRLEPDGRHLMCIDLSGVSLWERANDSELFLPRWRYAEPIADATFVPGADLVLFTRPGDALGWIDAQTGAVLPTTPPWRYARRLGTTTSGRRAYGWESNEVHLLDAASAVDVHVRGCNGRENPIVAIALDADADRVVMACEDGVIEDVASWSGVRTSARMAFGQSRPEASAIALTPNGLHLVVATRHGTVALVTIATGEIVREAAVDGAVTSLIDAAPLAGVWVRPDAGQVRRWDPTSGVWLDGLPLAVARHELVPMRDGTVVTVADRIQRWHVSGKALGIEQRAGISALALSHDGRLVAWGDKHGVSVATRDTGRIAMRHADVGRMVKSLAFAPTLGRAEESLFVATVGAPFLVELSDNPAEAPVALPMRGECRRLGRLGDRWLVVVPYEASLAIIDLGTREAHQRPLTRELRDAAFRRGAGHAALVDGDGQVFTLSAPPPLAQQGPPQLVPIGRPAREGELPTAIAATEDPNVVLVGVGLKGELRQLDGVSDRKLWTAAARIISLALSDDARWIAVGDIAGRLTVLDREGRVHFTYKAHADRVAALAFVPATHASELISVGWDGRVRRFGLAVLDAPPEHLGAAIEASWGELR